MPNITDKNELIRNLECTKHTFHITTYGISQLYHSYANGETLGNYSIVPPQLMGDIQYGLHNYLGFYEGRADKVGDFLRNCGDAFNSAERLYLRETFEWIKDYAIDGNKITFEAQPWYWMVYTLRNAVSHNWIIEFQGRKVKDFLHDNGAISYYGVDITLADEKKSPYELGWNRYHTMKLCDEMLDFANTLL